MSISDAQIHAAFEKHVYYSRGTLRVCDDLYQLDSFSRVLIVAFGISAHGMTLAFANQLGALGGGIICSPDADGRSQIAGFRYFHGEEPLPGAESARAAESILKALAALDLRSLAIYLISAGSSLVECPIDKEISQEDMAATYRALGDSSAKPEEAQAILKHLSSVKGGSMARVAGANGAQQVSIIISDPPGQSAASVACGPTMPDPTTVEDCYRIAAHHDLIGKFPASVRELFERRALEETPDKDHPVFHNCRWWPIN
jgi:glycerate 2-kinase